MKCVTGIWKRIRRPRDPNGKTQKGQFGKCRGQRDEMSSCGNRVETTVLFRHHFELFSIPRIILFLALLTRDQIEPLFTHFFLHILGGSSYKRSIITVSILFQLRSTREKFICTRRIVFNTNCRNVWFQGTSQRVTMDDFSRVHHVEIKTRAYRTRDTVAYDEKIDASPAVITSCEFSQPATVET